MDFDSPEVEKDFPGLYASESNKKNQSRDSDCWSVMMAGPFIHLVTSIIPALQIAVLIILKDERNPILSNMNGMNGPLIVGACGGGIPVAMVPVVPVGAMNGSDQGTQNSLSNMGNGSGDMKYDDKKDERNPILSNMNGMNGPLIVGACGGGIPVAMVPVVPVGAMNGSDQGTQNSLSNMGNCSGDMKYDDKKTVSRNNQVLQLLNSKMRVILCDNRTFIGKFVAYDKHMNLVLTDCMEYRKYKPARTKNVIEAKKNYGVVILHGENVMSVIVESSDYCSQIWLEKYDSESREADFSTPCCDAE